MKQLLHQDRPELALTHLYPKSIKLTYLALDFWVLGTTARPMTLQVSAC